MRVKEMIPTPAALGLVVCDRIERHPQTGKFSTLGSITGISVHHFPAYPDPFSVFATLKGGVGVGTATVEITYLGTGAVIYRTRNLVVPFTDRLSEVNFHLRVDKCKLPAAGAYDFTLWLDQDILAQRTIRVYQR
jgi:hypothetical protein